MRTCDYLGKPQPGNRFRRARFSQFVNLLKVSTVDSILDVGGVPETWQGTGLERNVTLINISFRHQCEPFKYVVGDACEMSMFQNDSFDVVFSNSVIEHVGGVERQRKFAAEVARIGQRYWVQTPSKHFPLEPHFLFPFFQYLPSSLQKAIGLRWRFSHCFRNQEDVGQVLSYLRLLTPREMSLLFEDATILKERFGMLTKSIIAYRDGNRP